MVSLITWSVSMDPKDSVIKMLKYYDIMILKDIVVMTFNLLQDTTFKL